LVKSYVLSQFSLYYQPLENLVSDYFILANYENLLVCVVILVIIVKTFNLILKCLIFNANKLFAVSRRIEIQSLLYIDRQGPV